MIMKTTMLDKLKAHLASITEEEFNREWQEIESLGLEGPGVDEFIRAMSLPATISQIDTFNAINYSVGISNTISVHNNNFAFAA